MINWLLVLSRPGFVPYLAIMKQKIGITHWGSVSALGTSRKEVATSYQSNHTFLQLDPVTGYWLGRISEVPEPKGALARRPRFLEQVDRTVLLSLLAVDQFWEDLPWSKQDGGEIGINIGSSRGATGLWEHYFRSYQKKEDIAISPLSSPTTTLGNLSSWLGAYLGVDGPTLSHSVTCGSALQALLNAVVWLESGRCRYFLAGGSEAPLTGFTVAQMKALRIYAASEPADYPCRSLDPKSEKNSLVLGEGAAIFALEANPEQAAAWITGIGCAQEIPDSPTSVSRDGAALQRAMRQALREAALETVDVVICHAPGTRKGDAAEVRAIQAVFDEHTPVLTGNKWKLGHTLGASGAFSLEMALLILEQQRVLEIPFLEYKVQQPERISNVMVNAMGFGGNAVSIIVGRI